LPEQHGGRFIADVLTLQGPLPAVPPPTTAEGGLAVAETPPRVRRRLSSSPAARGTRRTLTIRHVSGHRIVAVVEIVSPANKDRAAHVAEFADKAETALWQGIHVLVVDLFAPGPHDPQGMHAAIWERFDDEPYLLPPSEPLTLASYVAGPSPEAYLEHLAVGSPLGRDAALLEPGPIHQPPTGTDLPDRLSRHAGVLARCPRRKTVVTALTDWGQPMPRSQISACPVWSLEI
jgi:hypothetical protein